MPRLHRIDIPLTDDREFWRPLPRYVPAHSAAPRYYISPLGHVFRDDGYRVKPNVIPGRNTLRVQVANNKGYFPLPLSVYLAFTTRRRPKPCKQWQAWLWPGAPDDPLTGLRRCSIADVFLVPQSELTLYGLHNIFPSTRLPV